jgi:MHS family proline/betaine transporter-like MFS transporter
MTVPTPSLDAVDDPEAASEPEPAAARRAVVAGAIGNFVEWYDFTLYGASAPVLARVFFSQADPQAALLATFATFGIAFIARPFGAFFLGNLGDRIGRRNVLAAVVLVMSIGTALIALLPGYAQIGLWAPLLLLLIRSLQGFTAGGEFGGSAAFIVEYAPANKRGRYGSWQTATIALGSATATTVFLLFTSLLPLSQLDSWGWRVPYAVALPLGIAGLIMRMRMEETPDYQRVKELQDALKVQPSLPVWEAIRKHWRPILLGAAVVTGGTVGTYVFQNYIPAYLNTGQGVPLNIALAGNLIGLLVYAFSNVLWGRLSDRYGRKPFVLGGAIALLLLVYPVVIIDQIGTLWAIALGQSLFGLAASAIMGQVPTLLSEFFPTTVRMSGLSVSYTLANALFGGTAPFVVLWLVGITADPHVAIYYCGGAVLFTLIGALLIRETAHKPLRDV